MTTNLFNLALNVSGISQGFYDKFGDPLVVPPNFAADFKFVSWTPKGTLARIGSFAAYLRNRGITRFGMLRTFALGDILMLVPVARHMRKLGFDPYVITTQRYLDMLERLGIEAKNEHNFFVSQNGSYGIKLDGTVERDHIQLAFQKLHRAEIYFQALGVREYPGELDWSCELEKFPEVETDGKYVVFQGKGSTKAKSLPDRTISLLIERMTAEGMKVIYIGQPLRAKWSRPGLVEMAGFRRSLPELVSLIAGARCLISMDSAPFWISHFVRTPVVGVFGPTDPRVRVKYHPLAPDGCVGIELNDLVGCGHCFENAKRCGDKFRCLHVASEKVAGLVLPQARRFWEA